ncbi:hypothetical protein Tco_0919329, partial [Tanacetum coccineum]
SEHSTVTYTSVSFPVEDDSDIGSPGVDGPPIMPEDPYAYIMAAYEVPPSPDYIPGPEVPPSPDYIPGPEVPPSPDYIPGPEEPQSPPPLDFVPEPMYPEYMPQEDEILPAEEQPLPAAASPTADSPGYVPESDPEEDDEDPEEDPADYPADRDDDDDDDDDEDEDEDEEEEEEHPAPADSVPPRVRFASPTPSHEVGESSAAGAARQDRPAIARDDPYSIAREDLYGFVDMVDVPPRCSTSRELDYGITDTWDDLWRSNMYGIMERCFKMTGLNTERCLCPLHTTGSGADLSDAGALISELQITGSQETEGDFRVVGIRPQESGSVD